MDLETIKLLEAGGRRHDRKEAARWGKLPMYVADDPLIAKYFSDWIKDPSTDSGLPPKQLSVRSTPERKFFNKMNKICAPDDTFISDGPHLHYEQKFKEWDITVPSEAVNDFQTHNENFL
ncbi:hypothetical protein FA15DRAFT_657537 [Coprinopsis marcescibilis]|uniref:Uncharacterized protein n=1 Tax=Coprinopsis marcescibilis TaxID=230819 RepID=A0A5C3L2M4_COPMA|nr:hypothetical protein FA15DRAFT_657537 [Coprinopsis marcescibilis]